MTQKLTILRLQKEEASIERQPIPNAIVTRDGHLNFHFCLYNLQGPYQDGLYHGHFELHSNYPFNAPKLFFYTPSGRFQTNLPICTSFTNYHQQTWTSAWNVRSLILATISFMYSQEPSYGCRSDSQSVRKEYARKSKEFNFTHIPNFTKYFGQKLVDAKLITQQQLAKYTKLDRNQQKQIQPQVQVQVQAQPQFEAIIEERQQKQQLIEKNQENTNELRQLLIDEQRKIELEQNKQNNKNVPKKTNNQINIVIGALVSVGLGVLIYLKYKGRFG